MQDILRAVRRTTPSNIVGAARIAVGSVIAMTGVMKFVVPMLREAWSGQLVQAGIPLYTLNFWVVPAVEILVGVALAMGLLSRLSALVVGAIMIVATYVHLTVDDPSVFPLQPHQPTIPLIVIALAMLVVWRGGGSWSADLRAAEAGED